MTEQETLTILLDVYAYYQAYQIVKASQFFSDDIIFLLELLKERRELNVDFLFQNQVHLQELELTYHILSWIMLMKKSFWLTILWI